MSGRELTEDAISRFGKSKTSCSCYSEPFTEQTCIANKDGIRETIKRLLAFPPDTEIVFRKHSDSIAQRTALDQARQDKSGSATQHHHFPSKRRDTFHALSEESNVDQANSAGS